MKVYRLVECSGSYEDYMEHHVGTYANKEKAIEARKQNEQLNKEAEEQAILCDQCLTCDENGRDICQKLCMSFKALKNNPNDCANWSSSWGPCTYRIDEEEVIQ